MRVRRAFDSCSGAVVNTDGIAVWMTNVTEGRRGLLSRVASVW